MKAHFMGALMHSPGRLRLLTSWRQRLDNRWVVAGAGVVVMLTTGTLYSWAIFTQPLLIAFHWDVTATTWAYGIANFCLAAIGAVVGGFWQDRVGPRRVAMTGVMLWGAGNVAAGLGTAHWGCAWLYVTYGAIGGIGAGMAYITPVSMVTRWFPERRGLAGGMVAAGFGLGAFIFNQVVSRLEGFRTAARHASGSLHAMRIATAAGRPVDGSAVGSAAFMTPADISAVMHVFTASGLIYLIVGLIAASLFRNPTQTDGAREPHVPQPALPGLAPRQVIRSPLFYLLWLQLFINVIAGITVISNALLILHELTRVPSGNLAAPFGLISLCNAIGRLLWGAVSDRIGCQSTFAAMFVVQAVVLYWLTDVHDLPLALAGLSVILLCCGGGFGVMPAYNAECFGTRSMGLNYGLILSAWGFAGLVGPLVVARAKDLTGSFTGMLPVIATLLLLSLILPWLTHQSRRAHRLESHPRLGVGPEQCGTDQKLLEGEAVQIHSASA
jgi:nitrate/nitrite transporter NarK